MKLKLADFGLSRLCCDPSDPTPPSLVGTPFYIAPEMVRKKPYGKPLDMWSCGVVTYLLLSGRLPFLDPDTKRVLAMIRTGNVTFPPGDWNGISQDAKDFVTQLLRVDPEKRLTAADALHHPFLAKTI